jgi:flagellar biosynthesis chaperone FliJ
MSGRVFRYRLEPALRLRQWGRDALDIELAEATAAMREREAALKEAEAVLARGTQELQALLGRQDGLDVDRYARMTRYLAALASKKTQAASARARAEQERNDVLDRVHEAQRAVDRFEHHKDDMRRRFRQEVAAQSFKETDEAWTTLQAHAERHDFDS